MQVLCRWPLVVYRRLVMTGPSTPLADCHNTNAIDLLHGRAHKRLVAARSPRRI